MIPTNYVYWKEFCNDRERYDAERERIGIETIQLRRIPTDAQDAYGPDTQDTARLGELLHGRAVGPGWRGFTLWACYRARSDYADVQERWRQIRSDLLSQAADKLREG